MAGRESWSKNLKCPKCGREGVAWLSQEDGSSNQYGQVTTVDECPSGFEAREDEDDSNIFRFFCIADKVAADQ